MEKLVLIQMLFKQTSVQYFRNLKFGTIPYFSKRFTSTPALTQMEVILASRVKFYFNVMP